VDCVFVVCVVVEVGGGGIVGDVVVSVADVVVGGGDPPHPANKAKVPITAALANNRILDTRCFTFISRFNWMLTSSIGCWLWSVAVPASTLSSLYCRCPIHKYCRRLFFSMQLCCHCHRLNYACRSCSACQALAQQPVVLPRSWTMSCQKTSFARKRRLP
jgi:hypothetical protein